jgi:hypothetical protein
MPGRRRSEDRTVSVWLRASALVGGAALASLGAGCSHIHEPWVSNPQQYQQERFRSPALSKELDWRLVHTQIDR